MAKVTLTVRVEPEVKVWIERKVEKLDTTEAWIVETACRQMAGDELPRKIDEKPERRQR